MLQLKIPTKEYYNEKTNEFFTVKGATLNLEHSLLSISKWEAKWNKSFLSSKQLTIEQSIDYVRCMTLTQNVNPLVYNNLTVENLNAVNEYIKAPMTATTFSDSQQASGKKRKKITSELIYYWMVAHGIPFECQKWHLNRLLTLIQVCNVENSPKKKMSKNEIYSRNRKLNAARRKKYHTKG